MRADSSMPITQIAVITAIHSTPTSVTAKTESAAAVPADEQEAVEPGDLRQVRHHDDVGDDDRPAADPAGPRAHRPRHPRERRAAVRVGAVHVVVRRRDEQHREEGEDQHRRRLQADGRHHEREHRGERVARRGRGDADHHARDEAERVLLQPLVNHPSESPSAANLPDRGVRCPGWTTATVRSVGCARGCERRTGHPARAGDEAFRRHDRRRRARPGDAARRVLRAARALRLRQDHHAAHDRRLRGADRGPRLPRRRRRHRAARPTSATSTRSSSPTRCSRT